MNNKVFALTLLVIGLLLSSPSAKAQTATTPSFSTGTGTYYAPPSVKISESATCAVIYYTTDGSTPTTSSNVYTAPLTISSTTTLQAMAVCPGGTPSAVASATYTISAPYAPSFSSGTGTYYAPPSISIADGTKCATIYYTTDGTTPTASSYVYSGPISISSTTTLKAIAQCAGGTPSGVVSATYTVTTPYAPSFSTGTGTYYAPPTVSISEATKCAVVNYTLDGSTPTSASPVYTAPLTISSTTTVKAVAQCAGGSPSSVNSATYTVTTPVAPSLSTGTGTYYAPVSVTISELTKCATVYYTLDGSTPTTASNAYTGPITVSSTATLQAVAICAGGSPSSLKSATYTVSVPYAPSFSTGTGTYYAPPSVTMSEATKCATVYYTLDGSTPTTSSAVYSGPLTITSTATLKAIAQCSGGAPSAVSSATYTVSAPYAPSFSTGTGTYYAPPTVSISEVTKCATVYYTLDGSTPTTSSAVYGGPLTISSTTTLNAIAQCTGGSPSSVASATYTVSAPYAPSFSTGTGTYYAPPTVSISEVTKCATVYYTLDGSTPTTSSAVYSGPLTISSTTTLNAIAQCTGGSPSSVASATYTVSVPYTPSFSTGTGTYYAPPTVSISDGTKCAVIYYTVDGSTPTSASPVYSAPLTISSTTNLQAVAQCSGGLPSGVAAATYTLKSAVAPVISLASGTYNKSISFTLCDGTPGAVIYYTTDGTTPTAASTVYTGAITLSNTTSFSKTFNVQAVAIYPGGTPSPVTSASYTILSTITPVHAQNSAATFFGMNVHALNNGTPWPAVPVGNLRVFGAQNHWGALNPSRGVYSWAGLDNEIVQAQANGATVLYTIEGTPAWALPTNIRISSIQRSGGVVTVTTSSPHGMYFNPLFSAAEQSSITISGVNDSSFNGTFYLTGTPSATTLTYAQSAADALSSSGTMSAVCGGDTAPNSCIEAPASLSDWDNFLTQLMAHVGPGVIQYIELWNEANIGSGWHGDPNTLVSMAADARRIIKAVDPNVIILSPSTTINLETSGLCATYDPRCGSVWLNNWLAAGGKNAIDAVAFHGYPMVNESAEQIQGAITLLQQAMNQNGVGAMSLVDTESSWSLNSALPSDADQVAFLGRHLVLEHSMGVQRSFWYAYDNASWGTLWTSTAGLTNSGNAYRQVWNWLQGATLTQPCAPIAVGSTTYTCAYSRANGYTALAVWNSAGTSTFTVPQGYVQYRDLYGNIIAASPGSLTITNSPILLENKSAF